MTIAASTLAAPAHVPDGARPVWLLPQCWESTRADRTARRLLRTIRAVDVVEKVALASVLVAVSVGFLVAAGPLATFAAVGKHAFLWLAVGARVLAAVLQGRFWRHHDRGCVAREVSAQSRHEQAEVCHAGQMDDPRVVAVEQRLARVWTVRVVFVLLVALACLLTGLGHSAGTAAFTALVGVAFTATFTASWTDAFKREIQDLHAETCALAVGTRAELVRRAADGEGIPGR